mgnify:CR=1 FL=1
MKEIKALKTPCQPCGGATDVRLVSTEEWYDNVSQISRIMVAAGGGGAEWAGFKGGNGGEIVGGSGYYGR